MQRFALAALAAALIATPALAAEDAVKMRVNLKGINLSTEAGAEKALNRITRAAARACQVETLGTRVRNVDADCVTQMTARSVAQLNAPAVLAALSKRNGIQGYAAL